MEEALQFFRENEGYIYGVLFLLAIWLIRKFVMAWGEVRGAAFGLERESAQVRLNGAAVLLVLLLAAAMAEFMLVSFVIPAVPGAIPLLTPTIDLLATPTVTLSPALITPGAPLTSTLPITSTQEVVQGEGCIPGQLTITSPLDGEEIQGIVPITGTVNIPNFGFYQYEVARPGETIWLTIQVGREIKQDQTLGEWDTSTLDPGDYMLRLVATDNQGNPLATCAIRVRVIVNSENSGLLPERWGGQKMVPRIDLDPGRRKPGRDLHDFMGSHYA